MRACVLRRWWQGRKTCLSRQPAATGLSWGTALVSFPLCRQAGVRRGSPRQSAPVKGWDRGAAGGCGLPALVLPDLRAASPRRLHGPGPRSRPSPSGVSTSARYAPAFATLALLKPGVSASTFKSALFGEAGAGFGAPPPPPHLGLRRAPCLALRDCILQSLSREVRNQPRPFAWGPSPALWRCHLPWEQRGCSPRPRGVGGASLSLIRIFKNESSY